MAYLLPITDDHFAWLLSDRAAQDELRSPPGGVDEHGVLKMLRRATARLHAAGCHASWLIVDQHEVVGLCGFKRAANTAGAAEIGYGVAQSRRRQGYATTAVGLLIREVAETKAPPDCSPKRRRPTLHLNASWSEMASQSTGCGKTLKTANLSFGRGRSHHSASLGPSSLKQPPPPSSPQ